MTTRLIIINATAEVEKSFNRIPMLSEHGRSFVNMLGGNGKVQRSLEDGVLLKRLLEGRDILEFYYDASGLTLLEAKLAGNREFLENIVSEFFNDKDIYVEYVEDAMAFFAYIKEEAYAEIFH